MNTHVYANPSVLNGLREHVCALALKREHVLTSRACGRACVKTVQRRRFMHTHERTRHARRVHCATRAFTHLRPKRLVKINLLFRKSELFHRHMPRRQRHNRFAVGASRLLGAAQQQRLQGRVQQPQSAQVFLLHQRAQDLAPPDRVLIVRRDAQKVQECKEIVEVVLNGRARDRPPALSIECEHRKRSLRRASFDVVRLV
eukprot:5384777-Pleurochrysis_carterae.AAC.1